MTFPALGSKSGVMAAHIDRGDVLLYVNSHKILRTLPLDAQDRVIAGLQDRGAFTWVATGYSGHGGIDGSTAFDTGRFGGKPIFGEELTEDEQAAIDRVWTVIRERGLTLHIVDIGRESAFRRIVQEHLRHLRRLPVVVRPDGRRLEGLEEFSSDNLERFLADAPSTGLHETF